MAQLEQGNMCGHSSATQTTIATIAAIVKSILSLGNNYFCDTGTITVRDKNNGYTTYNTDNPLWDGEGCERYSTCCNFNNPPCAKKLIVTLNYTSSHTYSSKKAANLKGSLETCFRNHFLESLFDDIHPHLFNGVLASKTHSTIGYVKQWVFTLYAPRKGNKLPTTIMHLQDLLQLGILLLEDGISMAVFVDGCYYTPITTLSYKGKDYLFQNLIYTNDDFCSYLCN